MSKDVCTEIVLIEGLGIDGDAHNGVYVQHLSRVKTNPTAPNLRQVHLIHAELHDNLKTMNFTRGVNPGEMGENITTRGIDLHALPTGTKLHLGNDGAVVQLTGLRNPCRQLEGLQQDLQKACLETDQDGKITKRKGGVMSIVLKGGVVRPNDQITVVLPEEPHQPLVCV
ncbi:hypothetical protein SAMD00019534_035870 [Acytostelium subglobosum LB1]|uniref:hypothetical protein n=1 Tax=Acytostelium subglobosum LB1 TaxID=1410327 RepID=UPI000644B844|nr:hypothetical protein SAMD00019534_035870 [Acytostelium subglobosum LB1]GAM20412.1 hypothetical protein SAMD00019534_035870 [Acytostelium subglobosum LB1]|eukprot:XP_012759933.1 hypothetical protein SAMD00019534_035870 [Acytostelium subglobosum LB1]